MQTRLEVNYDAEGKAGAIQLTGTLEGTATFDGAAEPITKPQHDSINGPAISAATQTALAKFEAAVAADIQGERERIAAFRQAEADKAVAAAAVAKAKAEKEATEAAGGA